MSHFIKRSASATPRTRTSRRSPEHPVPLVRVSVSPQIKRFVCVIDQGLTVKTVAAHFPSVSDSHSDFFIRNLVAILAELRAAFGILKPNAIIEIDLTA